MDPAQTEDLQTSTVPPPVPPTQPPEEEVPSSPFRKFLPFIIVGIFLLVGLSSLLVLSAAKSSQKKAIPTPTPRPTATPFPAPTMPLVTKPATASAAVTLSKIGRLAFIRDGDIYNSDLSTFSLLVKNATPAGDKLSWSPLGNFLAWRQKSLTATPSALTIYDRKNKVSFTLQPSGTLQSELADYAFSPDEKNLVIVSNDNSSSRMYFYSLTTYPPQLSPEYNGTAIKIKQIFWPTEQNIIFLDEQGIGVKNEDGTGPPISYLVVNNKVLTINLSADREKILYSVGDNKKSDLYLMNIDGSNNRLISPIPAKIDMGTTNLPSSVVNNGFIPYAIFMPKGDSLLVGYHYLPNLPLVGIYNLKENSFSTIAPFILYKSDVMVDDLRLLGNRVSTTSEGKSVWQISLFTLEDNAKLSLIRVIPNASSPAFYGRDILPSGNTF